MRSEVGVGRSATSAPPAPIVTGTATASSSVASSAVAATTAPALAVTVAVTRAGLAPWRRLGTGPSAIVAGAAPATTGTVAVTIRVAPRVVRCDVTLAVTEHAQVAGRLYVGTGGRCRSDDGACPPPLTIVGNASRFARGLSWRLGTTPLRVDRWAFGDATTVWTVNELGSIDRLSVADPAAIALAVRHARTFTSRLVPLRLPEVVLFDFGALARVGSLADPWSILSRMYRLTVTATDAAGAVTRVSRHVHVIPYDHAPTAATLAIVPARDGIGPDRLQIVVSDPDDLATWDPTRFARVDWDGDGAFDTDWLWIGGDGSGRFATDVEIPVGAGPRTAVVEARDGFWATTRATIALP